MSGKRVGLTDYSLPKRGIIFLTLRKW